MENNHHGFIPDFGEFTPKDGEPYRPSNGTEGGFFQERWCEHCKSDRAFRDNGVRGCEILARSLCHDVGEKGYPVEWIWKNREPVCTAFDDVSATITNEERVAQLPLIV